LRIKSLYALTTAVFLFASCGQVSEEALNAGFKSDKAYALHIEQVKIKRNKNFKEVILYVSNFKAFDLDAEYMKAAEKLSREHRKYISVGGSSFKLLIASEGVLEVQGEIESVNNSQAAARKEAVDCILALDEPSTTDYASASYEILKSLYDMQVSLCRIKLYGSESLSSLFLRTHIAARQLVNSDQVFDSKETAESYFTTLLQKLENEEDQSI
jgi:hypothetical protein